MQPVETQYIKSNLPKHAKPLNIYKLPNKEKEVNPVRDFCRIFLLLITVGIALGVGTANAQQNVAQEAYAIFENSCLGCHGPNGPFTEQLVIESAAQLVASGAVVPGVPNSI